MRGKTILIILCAAIGTVAASAPQPPKWRWALTYDFHVDRVNGAPLAEPYVEHHQDGFCDYAMNRAVLDRFLMRGMGDGCKLDRFSYADGTISFAGGCPRDRRGLTFSVTGDGSYNDTTLRIDVKSRGETDGRKMEAGGTVTGVREARCD